ncbi:N-acetylmuramoyl-L-alanine amidase [Salmonella enterica]|uniref:N-acetylmuramoyl-L-alanine amidase n=1 Tax=Salmonella enterica TaxID=28901 RepID=UPI003F8850ED
MSGGVKSFAPFESAQIQALIPLAKDIIARYNIKPQNVVAHADIAPREARAGIVFTLRRDIRMGHHILRFDVIARDNILR